MNQNLLSQIPLFQSDIYHPNERKNVLNKNCSLKHPLYLPEDCNLFSLN